MNRTNELIEQLSADAAMSDASLRSKYFLVFALAAVWIGGFSLWIFNLAGSPIRSGYVELIIYPLIASKQLVPLLVAVTAVPLAAMLIRPEARLSMNTLPLVIALLILPILAAFTLVPMDHGNRYLVIQGDGFLQCLSSIFVLSVALITAQIFVLRQGAVTRPFSAGGIAGLAAGAVSAAIYAFICTEDSPGFYGLWYSTGILIAGAIGAVAGKSFLKW